MVDITVVDARSRLCVTDIFARTAALQSLDTWTSLEKKPLKMEMRSQRRKTMETIEMDQLPQPSVFGELMIYSD